MSAFLGPIHYWLYNKIKLQQELVVEIAALDNNGLEQKLDEKYGVFETKPLEEIIDTGNIHGWLQSRVAQVEYKLAYSVTSLLKKNSELIKEIERIFENKGNEQSSSVADNNVSKIYKAISDSLLDGMPCDNANTVLENSEDRVVWRRNTCVHKSYWEEVNGDINNYYNLREAFIRGFINDLPVVFEKLDDVTSIIRRSDVK